MPLDLPHASTVAGRIKELLSEEAGRASRLSGELFALLLPARFEEPFGAEAEAMRREALEGARRLTEMIERKGIGTDRLGQRVRNLFETLDEAAEGDAAGLRAGEDPRSAMRPHPLPRDVS